MLDTVSMRRCPSPMLRRDRPGPPAVRLLTRQPGTHFYVVFASWLRGMVDDGEDQADMKPKSLIGVVVTLTVMVCHQSLLGALDAAWAAGPAQPYDFNGDGYADRAIGVPGDRVGRHDGAGAVNVLYGSKNGLTAKRAQLWSQGTRGVRGKPADWEGFGSVLTSGDFDCDGRADLAAGSDTSDGPLVNVLYGGRKGLTSRDQLLGVTGTDEIYSGSAEYMTAGDFDDDGCDELVFSVPQRVIVYHGSSRGLRKLRILSIPTAIADEVATRFGQGLVAGDLTGDGVDDLAVGGASVDVNSSRAEGIAVIPGSKQGLQTTRSQRLAAPKTVESSTAPYFSYAYGSSMAIGDFTGDGRLDLAIGDHRAGREPDIGDFTCPGANFCPGAVVVHHGGRSGLSMTPQQLWIKSTLGAGPREGFGTYLATGDVNADGRDDLAVHQRWSVVVLPGTGTGLTTRSARVWNLQTPGVKGKAAVGLDNTFGCGGLQLLDHGRGRSADLTIDNPDHKLGMGGMNVLYGSKQGITARGDQLWTQRSRGVPGAASSGGDFSAQGDRFGGSRRCAWDMF